VEVRKPDGTTLLQSLDLQLDAGQSLVVTGPSGIGKSVLLASLAGVWPYATGQVRWPGGRDAVMFVPQLPYLPLGDLRTAVAYPRPAGAYDDADVQRALLDVALAPLMIRLTDTQDWSRALSVGEQQRIAFARVLLAEPAVVFLDESTSAMDEGLEQMLYRLLRERLPETIIVSVSHRATVSPLHESRLSLLGDGQWRLERLAPAG